MTQAGQPPNPEQMADRLAIIDVIHRYARGVDRASVGIMKDTCWPDAELDYGGYRGPAHPFLDKLPDGLRRYANTQHQITNTIIELNGNEAAVESYLTAHHYLPGQGGEDTEMTYIGRYLDRMEKREGVWKISFRRIVMTWHQDVAATADFGRNPSLAPIARATNDANDPLFAFLAGR